MINKLFDNNYNYNLTIFIDEEECDAEMTIKEIGEDYILFNAISKEGKKKDEEFKFLVRIKERFSTKKEDNNVGNK